MDFSLLSSTPSTHNKDLSPAALHSCVFLQLVGWPRESPKLSLLLQGPLSPTLVVSAPAPQGPEVPSEHSPAVLWGEGYLCKCHPRSWAQVYQPQNLFGGRSLLLGNLSLSPQFGGEREEGGAWCCCSCTRGEEGRAREKLVGNKGLSASKAMHLCIPISLHSLTPVTPNPCISLSLYPHILVVSYACSSIPPHLCNPKSLHSPIPVTPNPFISLSLYPTYPCSFSCL